MANNELSVRNDKTPTKSKKGGTDIEVKDPISAVASGLADFGVGVIHETFGMITSIVQSNNEKRVALAQINAELEKALAAIDANLKSELKRIDDQTKMKMKMIDTYNQTIQISLDNSNFPPELKMEILKSFTETMTTWFMNA